MADLIGSRFELPDILKNTTLVTTDDRIIVGTRAEIDAMDASRKNGKILIVTDEGGGGSGGMAIEIVNSLPAVGEAGKVYFVPNGGSYPDAYDSYVWLDDVQEYETLGTARKTKLSEFQNDTGFTSNVGTITGIAMNGSTVGTAGIVDLGNVGSITGIAMNGSTVGTSGVVNLGTVGSITGIAMNGSTVGTSGVVDLGSIVTNPVVSATSLDVEALFAGPAPEWLSYTISGLNMNVTGAAVSAPSYISLKSLYKTQGVLTRVNAIGESAFLSSTIIGISAPGVTEIGSYAFSQCQYLTDAVFADCGNIMEGGFKYCRSLTNASFPKCTYIGSDAFFACDSLRSVEMQSCLLIDEEAFYICSWLTSANFPECRNVRFGAFYGCSRLSDVSLPLCETIKGQAFYNCKSISHISLPLCSYIAYSAFHNCTSLADISLPMCLEVGNFAFSECPLSYVDLPVCMSIGDYALGTNAAASISLPACVSIGAGNFMNHSMTSVELPVCRTLGFWVFIQCSNLSSVSVPLCSYIYDSAFQSCVALSSFTIGTFRPSVALGGSDIFTDTPIASGTGTVYVPSAAVDLYRSASGWSSFNIAAMDPACESKYVFPYEYTGEYGRSVGSIPASKTGAVAIGDYGFNECSGISGNVYFPNCRYVGENAFYDCGLESASFPACLQVGAVCFQYCRSLRTASFPACLKVGFAAFGNCNSLESVSLPSCIKVEDNAFHYCSSLSFLNLPKCRNIGNRAFMDCYRLASAYLLSTTVPTLSASVFQSTPMDNSTYLGYYGSIYVRASLVESFKTATNWALYSDRIVGMTDTEIETLIGGIQ